MNLSLLKLSCLSQWLANNMHYMVLMAAVCTILYQQHTIFSLRNEFLAKEGGKSVDRHKRSVEAASIEYNVDTPPLPPVEPIIGASNTDQPFYFPLYTQLSSKAFEQICHEKFGFNPIANLSNHKQETDQEDNRTKPSNYRLSSNHYKHKLPAKLKNRKMFKEKVCTPIQGLGPKKIVGHRMYHRGSAIRHGDQWLLTEYSTGNTLFHFDLSASNSSEDAPEQGRSAASGTSLQFPTAMHTLTESFRGTDHAVAGTPNSKELVFYYQIVSAIPRIQALHLDSGRRMSRLLNATKTALYTANKYGISSSELSSIDLEIDQSALWAIYRQPGEGSLLTIFKMSPYSLKEVGQWRLGELDVAPSNLLNTFISCGVLYIVKSGDANQDESSYWVEVQPAFDFRTNRYFEPSSSGGGGGAIKWLAFGHISNVQYDAQTDSVNVFDAGNIYTMAVKRRRFH